MKKINIDILNSLYVSGKINELSPDGVIKELNDSFCSSGSMTNNDDIVAPTAKILEIAIIILGLPVHIYDNPDPTPKFEICSPITATIMKRPKQVHVLFINCCNH